MDLKLAERPARFKHKGRVVVTFVMPTSHMGFGRVPTRLGSGGRDPVRRAPDGHFLCVPGAEAGR